MTAKLPFPKFYSPKNVVADRWIDYAGLQAAAVDWRNRHRIKAANTDRFRLGVLAIDVQNTFVHPQGELYVAGMTGSGAVDDTVRLVEFIYRNLDVITGLSCTLDTHRMFAVFHPAFLVDERGNHPAPFTQVTNAEVRAGVWKPSVFAASALGINLMALERHLEHYTHELEQAGRYALTIWPYHGVLGDRGHTLASGLAEAANFHGLVRGVQPGIEVKGTNPLVENYSVLGPEVRQLFDGTPVERNTRFVEQLLRYDALVIAGQAKSHCVAWTIDDLLKEILTVDPALARKIYLLEDCTTAIVVKDAKGNVIYDYGPDADAAFDKFRQAGMHVVKSTDPLDTWPDLQI